MYIQSIFRWQPPSFLWIWRTIRRETLFSQIFVDRGERGASGRCPGGRKSIPTSWTFSERLGNMFSRLCQLFLYGRVQMTSSVRGRGGWPKDWPKGCREVDITEPDITQSAMTEFDITDILSCFLVPQYWEMVQDIWSYFRYSVSTPRGG